METTKPHNRILRAFTLLELLVILAIVSLLAVLLLPTMRKARASTAKAQCAANLRQLGAAITLFAGDHMASFPAGADETADVQLQQWSWDTYINFYITGHQLTLAQLTTINDADGFTPAVTMPGILRCPADTGPDTFWLALAGQGLYGRRTYAMNATTSIPSGQTPGPESTNATYVLPPVVQGVGVYWTGDANSGINAAGYKTSVVSQPASTILLCESANGRNNAANVWPATCLGPWAAFSGTVGDLVQICPEDSNNEGAALYANHGSNFNYLFHDNHVAPYKIEQTVGPGSTNIAGPWTVNGINGVGPKGFWTITNPNVTN
jgi:type II secretory pathway pseudopilin PulG